MQHTTAWNCKCPCGFPFLQQHTPPVAEVCLFTSTNEVIFSSESPLNPSPFHEFYLITFFNIAIFSIYSQLFCKFLRGIILDEKNQMQNQDFDVNEL